LCLRCFSPIFTRYMQRLGAVGPRPHGTHSMDIPGNSGANTWQTQTSLGPHRRRSRPASLTAVPGRGACDVNNPSSSKTYHTGQNARPDLHASRQLGDLTTATPGLTAAAIVLTGARISWQGEVNAKSTKGGRKTAAPQCSPNPPLHPLNAPPPTPIPPPSDQLPLPPRAAVGQAPWQLFAIALPPLEPRSSKTPLACREPLQPETSNPLHQPSTPPGVQWHPPALPLPASPSPPPVSLLCLGARAFLLRPAPLQSYLLT
jgi:hypothetical protein